MKSLGDRLRRTVGDAPPEPEAPPETAPGLKEALDRYDHLRRHAASGAGPGDESRTLEEAIGGCAEATPHGAAWVVDTRVPLTDHHGSRRLGAFYERAMDHLPALVADPRLDDRVSGEALFLDIESSGLDHGAGTHAFLVGLGYREDDHFVVRQLLLREPGEEQALLQLLVERLDEHPLLVSFNGKSFDLTVLQTRLVMQRFYSRRDCDLKLRPHLDLLHLSRNLYRDRWPDTRLGTLEQEVLGFEREGDIPGHMVPSCWFHWLRTGDAGPLAGVMLHNLHDVLSMVTLADRVLVEGEPAPDPTRAPRVTVNLARLLARRKDPEGAFRVLEPLLDEDVLTVAGDDLGREALLLAATVARRTRRTGAQRRALERLVAHLPDDPEALTALAIVEERARRLEEALDLAIRAQRVAPGPDADKRVARLEKRLGIASQA
ncbi:MAG: ribonuclease H-like domain-containing protein [Myxococcota bacterium]